MTSPAHQSGTDRIAEVAAEPCTRTLIVNVQGDEPLIEPAMIDEAVAPFAADADADDEHAAPAHRRRGGAAESERHQGRRRSPTTSRCIFRARRFRSSRPGSPAAPAWRHVGLYVYRRECLLRLAALPPTAMEKSEALEQLRALEHGIRIKAVETQFDSIGVDTPEDLARVRARSCRHAGASRHRVELSVAGHDAE